jgi:hypothetical protein
VRYLQNAVTGILNTKQNQIVKVFTIITAVFLPPTLRSDARARLEARLQLLDGAHSVSRAAAAHLHQAPGLAAMRSIVVVAGLLLAEGARAAHPLNTEDTGTQGRGGWQLEVNGERNRDEVEGVTLHGAQASMVLAYGAASTMDLQLGLPWQDNGAERGGGDAFAALKWRFWERGPLSAGIRAGVTTPTGDETRDLGNGRPTWAGLLIGQYEGERWIFLGHLGHRRNLNSTGDRDSIAEISGAVLYKATPSLKLLLDANRTTNPDPATDRALQQAVIGAIYSATKDFDLDAGFRRGNDPATGRALMAGVTLRW